MDNFWSSPISIFCMMATQKQIQPVNIMTWSPENSISTVNQKSENINLAYGINIQWNPFLRGHPDKRPTPLERPLDTVNLNINILISTPDERQPHLKGHFSGAKWGGLTRGIPLYDMLLYKQKEKKHSDNSSQI